MAHCLPPSPYGLDREFRRVAADPDADPTGIVTDVIDSVGADAAQLSHEVVDVDSVRRTLRAVLATCVLVVPDEFLLLGVN